MRRSLGELYSVGAPPARVKRSTVSVAKPSAASRRVTSSRCGVTPRFSCAITTAGQPAAGPAPPEGSAR